MTGGLPLTLARAVVRPFRLEDAPALAHHANDRAIWKNLRDRFPHPYSEHDASEFIGWVLRQPVQGDFAIEVEGEAAGSIGFHFRTDIERVGGEIGYWLGRAYWGQGIMTEVVRATTDWAIDHFGWVRVLAVPFAHNVASCRLLERVGYQLEGRMRRNAIKDGEILDQLLYAYVPEGGTWR